MLPYLTRKLLALLVSLFVIATATFFLMKMVPGDPFSEEQSLREDMHDTLRKQYGMDQPWIVQYGDYLNDLLHGKLGYSLKYPGRSVNQIITESFPVSAWLGVQSFMMALFFGVTLGTLCALRSQRFEEKLILVMTTCGIAIPSFILAALLQYVFAIYFPLLPIARWGSFSQTILPSLALSAAPMAFITRLTRSELSEVLKSDYIKLCVAKGLPISIWLWRHALRNALLPVLTYLGPLLANVLVGSFVIEKIFSIPGLGSWFVNSVSNRDYSLIMGLTLFYSLILLSAVFLVDLLYGFWDPRIRLIQREN